MFQLTNKIAVVTGGGSGIGKEICLTLAKQGAKVFVIDLNIESAQATCDQIIASGFLSDAIGLNVSNQQEVKTAFTNIGTFHILVNCAGIATPSKIIGKQGVMPLDFFQHIVNVNLFGSFNMMRLCSEKMMGLDLLEDDQRGVIISTASIAAYEGQIGQL